MEKQPVRVCVTGAAGQIGYSLVPMIASGQMLGPDQPVILHLLDIPMCEKSLKGVVMELIDSAFPLLKDIVATTDPEVAFKDVDIAILVGAFPRKAGMERKDLLMKNKEIFKQQGQAINKVASRNIKVLVVGNPANTNALICKQFAPDIPAKNFSALTRLDHNRARSQVAQRAKVPVTAVKNVTIWGNHSSTQYPDVNHGFVQKDGLGISRDPIRKVISDDSYLNGEFITTVQKRGAAIIEARGLSSAASASRAIVDHVRDWMLGTPEGEWVSMAVTSDGNTYGVPEGLIFSFPVKCCKGEWKIVEGLEINEFSREKLKVTAEELSAEKETAFSGL